MMRKFLVFAMILVVCFLFTSKDAGAVSMSNFVAQLKMKLAEDEPEFPDSILEELIRLSYNIVIPHGLAYETGSDIVTASGKSTYYLFGGNILFISSVRKLSGGQVRSLIEIRPQDLGRQELETSVPLQYFCYFRHLDSCFIYIDATPTTIETLQVLYYMATFDDDEPDLYEAWEEVILDCALFLAFLRKKDWALSALAYNEFRQSLSVFREFIVNKKLDIFIAPKEIE